MSEIKTKEVNGQTLVSAGSIVRAFGRNMGVDEYLRRCEITPVIGADKGPGHSKWITSQAAMIMLRQLSHDFPAYRVSYPINSPLPIVERIVPLAPRKAKQEPVKTSWWTSFVNFFKG